MLLVITLIFGVACSAFPFSKDGPQCVAYCFFEADFWNASEVVDDLVFVAELSRAQHAYKPAVASSFKPDICAPLPTFVACVKSCPPSREDAVAQQITRTVRKQCSPTVSIQQREKFLQSCEELGTKLIDRTAPCEIIVPEDDEALCKYISGCVLGSALSELKADYPTDVVASVADAMKLFFTFSLKDPNPSAEACSIIFEPY